MELVKFERFHLVGHSMGGLTALMLAQLIPERVLSFTDIEGNIAPEDCFLSRQIIEYDRESDEQFLLILFSAPVNLPIMQVRYTQPVCRTKFS
ncbi:alpha/beta fold hydrolase [Vibrio sinaloensis]|nr:alpha/beta fold hydrolase [Vibrio sinaloensis]